MQVSPNLLFVLQILSAVAMIGLVLIQHGKGADMGASFGSGASGSLFGATGSANFLSRSTAICATVFFAATLGMSVAVHRPRLRARRRDESPRQRVARRRVRASAAGARPRPAAACCVPASAPSAVQAIPTR